MREFQLGSETHGHAHIDDTLSGHQGLMNRVREEKLLSQGLVAGHDPYQLHHAPLAVPHTYVFVDDCLQEETSRLL